MKALKLLVIIIVSIGYILTRVVGPMIFTFSAATMFLATRSVALSIFAGVMSIIGIGVAVAVFGLSTGGFDSIINGGKINEN